MAGKGESKTSKRRVAAKARHTEFFNLRAAGFTLEEIARRFNVTKQSVDQAIQNLMSEMPSEAADRYRTLVTARLEKAYRFFEKEKRSGPKAERLNAAGRGARVAMELAKLHGCYVEVTMPVTQNNIQQLNVQQNATIYIDYTKFTEEQLERHARILTEHAQLLADVAERGAVGAGSHPEGNGASGNGHAPEVPPPVRP